MSDNAGAREDVGRAPAHLVAAVLFDVTSFAELAWPSASRLFLHVQSKGTRAGLVGVAASAWVGGIPRLATIFEPPGLSVKHGLQVLSVLE